jgi:NAD dependent epimerase/dehydratase family enzyme
MRTLVTGATGLIGRALIDRLESAVVLTRDQARAKHSSPKSKRMRGRPRLGRPLRMPWTVWT